MYMMYNQNKTTLTKLSKTMIAREGRIQRHIHHFVPKWLGQGRTKVRKISIVSKTSCIHCCNLTIVPAKVPWAILGNELWHFYSVLFKPHDILQYSNLRAGLVTVKIKILMKCWNVASTWNTQYIEGWGARGRQHFNRLTQPSNGRALGSANPNMVPRELYGVQGNPATYKSITLGKKWKNKWAQSFWHNLTLMSKSHQWSPSDITRERFIVLLQYRGCQPEHMYPHTCIHEVL